MNKNLCISTLTILLLSGCGALEHKAYPEDKSITTGMLNHSEKKTSRQKLDSIISSHLDSTAASPKPDSNIFPASGNILIINTLAISDTGALNEIINRLENNEKITNVMRINLPAVPAIEDIRLISAKNGARYAMIINEFSNNYQYHNAWTIPSVLGLGIPYFFLDTQTIIYLSKVEASVLDVENNLLLLNESVSANAEGKATRSGSGVMSHKLKEDAMTSGMKSLQTVLAKDI